MKFRTYCGNVKDSITAVSRCVWKACYRKVNGKYQQFSVILDSDGNVHVYTRDTINGRRITLTSELEKARSSLVGVYAVGRQRTAPFPNEIADDIEAAMADAGAH